MNRTIKGVTYYVPDRDIDNALKMFDLWRDGKGPLTGALGRELILLATQRIANDIASKDTDKDRMAVWRLRKVLRSIIGERRRNRGTNGGGSQASKEVPRDDQSNQEWWGPKPGQEKPE
jgi:hypothetical protein